MNRFEVISPFKPQGDQPQAIDKLASALNDGRRAQVLMGVTGSGKTFTMANVVAAINRPTLVISHNKTLAAQLYEEFKDLFPNNAVGYFVSYYDYYQPEAYIPQRDIYIEKDASRNDDLDRLRLSATSNLMGRRDVLLVASVSCIFGLGSPESYKNSVLPLRVGEEIDRDAMLRKLIDLQYARNDIDFKRGAFRVRGDVVELHPSYEEFAYRIEFFGDEISAIDMINPLTGELLNDVGAGHAPPNGKEGEACLAPAPRQIFIYPAVHYVMPEDHVQTAVQSIREELDQRVMQLRGQGKLLEAQRLLARTKYDIEMILEVGFCSGIENYSRHLDGRKPGEKPYTLIDYFPKDYLLIIDESHVAIPQLRAMFNGDRHRKETLVEHGFRLPSALDNRPLRFEEFEKMINQVVFVSATPAKYELEQTGGEVIEQVIRPTGLVDPEIFVHPAQGQVPHLLSEIKKRAEKGERVLVTTLTKRLAEDLSAYIQEAGIRGRYLHSEIQTLERVQILKDLRQGDFDVLVGVNLLREGLDLPEVSMVAILDADKAGFLRSETSIIQMIGRAARNVNAKVWLYADAITPAMRKAIDETARRRQLQLDFNQQHNITPQTIQKAIRSTLESEIKARHTVQEAIHANDGEVDRTELIRLLEEEMLEAARNLEFERAAQLRDQLQEVKGAPLIEGNGHPQPPPDAQPIWQPKSKGRGKRNVAK
jgi:excinuclease ABC subunit B